MTTIKYSIQKMIGGSAHNRIKTCKKHQDSLLCQLEQGQLSVKIFSENIVQILYALEEQPPKKPNLTVVPSTPENPAWALEELEDKLIVKTTQIQIHIDRKDSHVAFFSDSGNRLLRESIRGRFLTPKTILGEQTYQAQQLWDWSEDEAIYGLGQHQNGLMNYRGHDVLLTQTNTTVAVPFLLSSTGYGILWDNCSETEFRDRRSTTGAPGSIWSEAADSIDYYFVYGPTPDQVISGYRYLTGKAPLFPKWAYGLFQCKERYDTQEELLNAVREYRRRQIPLDCIVQDWRYWDPYPWGSHRFDPARYPDPEEMIQELHAKHNCRFMISVWPRFVEGSDNYEELKAKGLLYDSYELEGVQESYYDAFSPEARALYWKQLRDALLCKGVDGWWLDATEPELHPDWDKKQRKKHVKTACGSGTRCLNAYSLMTTRAVYEGQRECAPQKRVYILSRSAFSGQQRYGAVTWSGDIKGTWEIFRKQIPAGLNFCMSGIPYWATDIGGFFVDYEGGSSNDDYRELFVRWFQYGAFCPIFRVHGTSTPREMWHFGDPGDEVYDTLLAFDQLRYRLLPYIYSLAWQIYKNDYTLMRALAFDFAEDSNCLTISDQYMFGPAFMVAPVTRPQALSRSIYLPQNAHWFDFWTGEIFEGGQTIESPAPLNKLPLYVKAGSIIPMGPFLQYSTEKQPDPIELRIYGGADASFTLYDDENDSYNYERGLHTFTSISWDDASKRLTIHDQDGTFPDSLRKREFRIVLVDQRHGTGPGEPKKATATISYCGEQISSAL